MTAVEEQARSIFLAALERAPSEWPALLEEACVGNIELRAHVEQLLRAHEAMGSIHGGGGRRPVDTIDQPAVEHSGAAIGPYKLIEKIGEGGMGTVWMAQQTEPVKRLVALKLIKAGMDSAQVIARFEAERQALALMDHTNLARVLDAGTTAAGRPYFVMDLVKGMPITRYCDEHPLTPRQRLELFIPLCQAVQHAHQKGIIHRDLKPSNVLVAMYDGKPVPKVIDFGVAKATGQSLTDKTLVTGFGNIVGTLEYMSPEQAEVNQLDIDTRSDIYSLGVLLYELLAGSTPFSRKELGQAGMLEMLRVIREQEPSKPSTKLSFSDALPTLSANRGTDPTKLTKLVRGELDWIVMKALEKDRSRRYETANGFAADLHRYLLDEPVQACPPSAMYRCRKFARRNKGSLAVAALVLLFFVLLGSGVGFAVRDRSAREAAIAQERAHREAELTREREARIAKVAAQVESIFAEIDLLEKEQKWPEALAAARRAKAAVAGGEADAETAQGVRGRLKDLAFIERLEQIRLERATFVNGNFNNAGAERDYARSFRDYGVDIDELAVEAAIHRLKARSSLAIPLAAALDDWVDARRRTSEKDSSDWKKLVAVARGIDPEPLRDRLRSIWGRPISEVRDELRGLAESIDVQAQHPATVVVLAGTLWRINDADSATRVLRDAQLVSPGDFWLNDKLGFVLYRQKDYETATRFYAVALAIRPNSVNAHNNLGLALSNSAVRLFRQNANRKDSQPILDEAIACFNKAIDLDARFTPAYNNLGAVYCDYLGDYGKAIECFRKVIEVDPQNALAHYNLGNALWSQQKPDEAIDAYRKSIELNPKYAAAHYNLGNALRAQKKLAEAIDAYRKSAEVDPGYLPALANAYRLLAKDYFSLGNAQRNPGRAVILAKEAVALNSQVGAYWNTLGAAQYRANDWKAAIAALEKSMDLRKGGDSSDWFFLAMAHWQLGEKDTSRQWFDKAVEWMDKNQPKNEELRRFREEAEELMKKE
jgi:serine/threonine protein kinase/tetratricopeptide (TPR) repeat protein